MRFDLEKEERSIIKVIGVGGGGSNAVNYMYRKGIRGVEFIVCNTDIQALEGSPAKKIQLGSIITKGRGAGAHPEVGKNAAIESIEEVKAMLADNTEMVFITAGMGGGTGTGAAPVIAKAAKEMGILTVGIVTIPFNFEGKKRKQQAEAGLEELRGCVDTLIVVSNDKLRSLHGKLALTDAFAEANSVVATAAKSIAEIITGAGLINVDLNDVKTVMTEGGAAIMGAAMASGENRHIRAAEGALCSPLLNDSDIRGAKQVLLYISGGNDELTMDEVAEISDFISEQAGDDANVIVGTGFDSTLGDNISVIVITTGFSPNKELLFDASKPEQRTINQLYNEKPQMVLPQLEENVAPAAETSSPAVSKVEEEDPNEIRLVIKAPVVAEQKTLPFESPVNNINDELPPPLPASYLNSFQKDDPEMQLIRKNPESISDIPSTLNNDHQAKARANIAKLKEMSEKMRQQNGIAELEKQPAFERRNIKLDLKPLSSESQVSRYTLSENDDKRSTDLRQNNSFLHDAVD